MNQEQNKGQDFVSQKNLKNQLFGKKTEDVGALNKTMGSFASNNIKALNSLNKQIGMLNQNISKLAKPTSQKKDLVRREDPSLKLYKSVDGLEGLFAESLKIQKEANKKKVGGLLGLFGGLAKFAALAIAGGGLLGFLMTGKTEFLFSTVKGLKKFFIDIPIMMFKATRAMAKMVAGSVKIAGNAVKGTIKLAKSAGNLVKNAARVGKAFQKGGVAGAGKAISRIGKAGKAAKLGAKLGGKAAAKGAGKTVGKTFLKKIPVVGGLLGLFFGIQRFKKGDIVGGMLEIASGLASTIPVAGTAIGIAIDAFLLFRDFKGVKLDGGEKKEKKKGGIGNNILRNIPVVGSVMRFMEGVKLWKTDKIGAMKAIAGSVGSLIPGGGLVFDSIFGIIDMFKKDKNEIDAVTGADASASVKDIQASGAGAKPKSKKGFMAKAWGATKKAVSSVADSTVSALQNATYERAQPDGKQRGVEDIAGQRGKGWYTYKPWSPILNKLDKKTWNNFQGMASEYFDKTGNLLQINSAYRNQKGSVHGAGYAMDINSTDVNNLEKQGLMEKWGFHRPLIGMSPSETWHVEPYPGKDYGARNTNNYAIRSSVAKGKAEFGGDNLNLPQSEISGKVTASNQNNKIDLTDATIQALAQAMGASFKGVIPKSGIQPSGANVAMRG